MDWTKFYIMFVIFFAELFIFWILITIILYIADIHKSKKIIKMCGIGIYFRALFNKENFDKLMIIDEYIENHPEIAQEKCKNL